MHINSASPFAVSVKHRREKSEICEILPENVISCQAAPNGAQQEKRPSEKPLGMSRKKFSNGGGQEKCNGTKFAAKFGCDAAVAAVAKHGRCRRQKSFNKKEVKMNKIYRTVYNETTNTWTAVAEIAKAKGKSKSSKTAVASVAVVGALLSSAAVQAAGLTWGTNASAPLDESIAMGNNSKAKSKYTIVLGTEAENKSNGEAGVLIGYGAQAFTDANPNTALNTMGQQVAIGEASKANSQSIALGAQTYAIGQASIAIGGDDLGNNDTKTSAGKHGDWRDYSGQPIEVEGVTTTDASTVGFVSTTASGRGSIALGHMGYSTGNASVAVGVDTYAKDGGSIAMGMSSQSRAAAATAIGVGAKAEGLHSIAMGLTAGTLGENSIALGTSAKANKVNDVAIGNGATTTSVTNVDHHGSVAVGSGAKASARNDISIGSNAGSGNGPAVGARGERITLGTYATVGSNQDVDVDAGGSFGTVRLTNKTVGQSIAIGSGTSNQPQRRTYAYGDQSVALGADTLAYGDSSVAIGGDDLDTASTQQTTYTDPQSGNQVTGSIRSAYEALTGDTSMQVGNYIKTVSKHGAVAVGVQAQASDLGAAFGAKSSALNTASTALGVGAVANKDNAVALGAASITSTNATGENSATVNGVTYGGFAGGNNIVAGDQVSVGNVGFERQIKHVAPGAVTAASTDAINGSQLYSVANELGKGFTIAANTDATGVSAADKTVKPGNTLAVEGSGTGTFATDYSTDNIQTQVSSKGTIKVGLKNDLNVTSVTATDSNGNQTVTNGNGVTITPKAPAAGQGPVSLTSNGLNNGGNKITNVAPGTADTDAVNVSQLKAVGKTQVKGEKGVKVTGDATKGYTVTADTAPITIAGTKAATPAGTKADQLATAQNVVDAINGSGFTLKSSAAAGGEKDTASTGDEVINPGDILDMAAGKNLKVKQEANGKITYATKDQVAFDKVTVGGVVIDKADGINAGGKKVTNVAPGTLSANSTDAVNGSQLYTVANNPLTFAGDTGTDVERKLGSKVNVKGGVTDAAKLSDNNIGVVANGTDGLNVKLAKELKDLTSAGFKDAAGNVTKVGGNGVTITPKNPAAGQGPVSLTSNGLNNG
ncbi:ESPR-type extended signal peptide-containing protein, partial [Neisseria bacilliformis]|uniref:ESPR-type extended signal peptide-containing protein n=1 Tax=Neisseria bacilliformis TaxID=267212 RepID=UPI0028E7829A